LKEIPRSIEWSELLLRGSEARAYSVDFSRSEKQSEGDKHE